MGCTIGYAQDAITPSLERPVFLAGFDRDRRAVGVHDDLFVRVLALQDGSSPLALVAVDLIGLGRKVSQRCEKRLRKVIPGLHLVLACTHTHHGPDTIGLWGPNERTRGVDWLYMHFLENRVIDTVKRAFQHTVPASLRTCSVYVPGVVKNARDPEILDQEITCLQFVDPDSNQVLVTLANFPCHPETLWKDNPQITSDYPHYLRQQLDCFSQAPSLFFSGALGGMMTPDVSEHTFTDAEQIGIMLAQAASDSLTRQTPINLDSYSYQRLEYQSTLQNPLFEQAMRYRLVRDTIFQNNQILTEVGLLRLGPVWLAHVPGELLPKLGLQLKQTMRSSGASVTGILGLTNDEIGYILPDEDFIYPPDPLDPGDHYEETMSTGPNAGSQLMYALESLIKPNSEYRDSNNVKTSDPGW